MDMGIGEAMGEQVAIIVACIIVLIVVLGGIALILGSVARPKGKEIALFTSSAPDEAIIAYKVVNACLSNAEPNAFAAFIFKQTHTDNAANKTFDFIRKMTGGLWVGGRVVLTNHRIIFTPNGLNRALHKDLPVIALFLTDLTEVRDRFGVATSIVDAMTPVGSLTFRCYGANKFSKLIRDAHAAALSKPQPARSAG
jgi:hypothetical protein